MLRLFFALQPAPEQCRALQELADAAGRAARRADRAAGQSARHPGVSSAPCPKNDSRI